MTLDFGRGLEYWTLGAARVSEEAVRIVQSESNVATLAEGCRRRREGREGLCRLDEAERLSCLSEEVERCEVEVDPVRDRDRRKVTFANSTR